MVDVIYPLPLCRSSCIIICYTFNKVKLLNFTVSKNDQVLYPLIQWDSLFLLSDIMLWHWTSFITRGILFQKLNWYRQQDLMILSQCHSSTAEVTCTMLRVLGRARLSATPRSVAASFPYGIVQARILERAAICSSRGSSWPRDWTHVSRISCTGRRILHHCATWEAQSQPAIPLNTEKQSLPKFINAKYLKYNNI